MKTALTILCVISAMCAAGADKKPSERKTSLSAAELRTLATSVPDTKTASMLHSVAMATSNNVDLQQEYLKAAAACLIACDKKDVYAKHIKSKLLNVEEFENDLKDDCKQCAGEGTKERRCSVCNGKGKCTSCKGSGQTASYGFDRPKEWKPCRKCDGSGQCGKCEGEGVIKERCKICTGTGKAFSKAVASRVYRDLCNSIADGMAAEAKPDIEEKRVQRKCVTEGVNTSASTPKATADSSGRNEGEQNATKLSPSRASPAKVFANELDKYTFFEDGCLFRIGGCHAIYTKDLSGGVNYLISTEVNLRPQIQFSDGGGAYYDSDIILFSYPTSESRKLWSSAMHSAFEKMLEWINTAKDNKVGHVEKELPESAFKNNCAYASVDWLDRGARQKENYFKAWRKYMDTAGFSKSARRVGFKCVIDSGDDLKFSAKLLAGCAGEFPFVLYSCSGKTTDEISASVHELLRQMDPDSLAKAWEAQIERNSMFEDVAVSDNSSCDRLSVSKKDEADARKSADSYCIVHSDSCESIFVDHCRGSSHPGGRDVFIVKDVEGDLNYILRLGENGVARRRTYFGRGIHTDSDFAYDYHLIVFPTEKLRKRWYEVVKKSCAMMLAWMDFAAKEHVPIVAKPIYDADKDTSNKLIACHNLITKGQGQDDLLKKSLRMHMDRSECERNGFPVSLICTIKSKNSEFENFEVNIELKCGDRYRGNIFEASGNYKYIQKECVRFLHKVDPDSLMEAWKEKCGRDELFR